MDKEEIMKLKENLETQLEIYGLLKDISEKKKDVLIAGKIDKLDKLVQVEQRLITKSFKLEREREEFIGEKDILLKEIIDTLEGEEKEDLTRIREELEQEIVYLKELNQQNNALIQQSLAYIENTLELLTSSGKDPGTYSNKGNTPDDKRKNKSILDQKI